MKIPVYNIAGEKIKEAELDPRIFGVKPKTAVLHQVVVAQQNNGRQVLAHTKGKGEVRGGGKKPWRQKGTGRARHGSIRSPLWRGGGITFGPTSERNFSQKVNKKQKQLALAMCLSDKAAGGFLAVFDKLELASGKTKDLNNLVKNLKSKIQGLNQMKKTLIVLDKNDEKIINASLNLKNISVVLADSLNCVALLKHDGLMASEAAVKVIEKHYQKNKK